MKLLTCLLLPVVCLGGSTETLIDQARGVPPEFAADALIRIAALDNVPKDRRIELLQEAFESAASAQHPYKMRAARLHAGSAAAFLNRAYLQDLDGLSLRLRAIDALLAIDPAKARALFEQIPPMQLPAPGCGQPLGYDVSALYATLGRLPNPARLIDRHLAISSPAEVGPAARLLAFAPLADADFRAAVTAYAAALRLVAPDDRSFTLAAGTGAGVTALVQACRNRGVSPAVVTDAYRQYLAAQLAGEHCGQAPAADPVDLSLVGPIETAASHADAEAEPASPSGCDDAGCQAAVAAYRRLVFNEMGLSYTEAERTKSEWRAKLPAVLEEFANWNEGESVPAFAAKAGLYTELASTTVVPADRELVDRATLDFLRRSPLRSTNRMEWLLPLNALLARKSPALENSPDAVIALYVALEKAAPRPSSRLAPLL